MVKEPIDGVGIEKLLFQPRQLVIGLVLLFNVRQEGKGWGTDQLQFALVVHAGETIRGGVVSPLSVHDLVVITQEFGQPTLLGWSGYLLPHEASAMSVGIRALFFDSRRQAPK